MDIFCLYVRNHNYYKIEKRWDHVFAESAFNFAFSHFLVDMNITHKIMTHITYVLCSMKYWHDYEDLNKTIKIWKSTKLLLFYYVLGFKCTMLVNCMRRLILSFSLYCLKWSVSRVLSSFLNWGLGSSTKFTSMFIHITPRRSSILIMERIRFLYFHFNGNFSAYII